ncbi:hypothetical protein PL75_10360 [Neisseria arctica]|uniref:Uncharacterized protein n=1 Tax=Neisseria arctica TaxID=1470200 RepID=A0A0J0YPG4_9NEIS|nr:hypothetical protein [Neisseria arctica]KLT72030.1 hypothetical protein PL75_10360 [Neisseria arctica]UOO86333.1 hypothetical protein LVJ86_08980 [Neisseria arctica]
MMPSEKLSDGIISLFRHFVEFWREQMLIAEKLMQFCFNVGIVLYVVYAADKKSRRYDNANTHIAFLS